MINPAYFEPLFRRVRAAVPFYETTLTKGVVYSRVDLTSDSTPDASMGRGLWLR